MRDEFLTAVATVAWNEILKTGEVYDIVVEGRFGPVVTQNHLRYFGQQANGRFVFRQGNRWRYMWPMVSAYNGALPRPVDVRTRTHDWRLSIPTYHQEKNL